MLTQCYAAVFPFDSGKMYKINAFSEIFRKNGSYYLKEGNKEILLEGCFLFNGSDTYLFLEEITVTYGNKAVNIGPFSVVAAHYGQQSSIYQYRSKNNLEILADAGALVASLGQGYFVQMDTDSLISEAGQQLLYTRPENLKNLK